MGGCNGQKEEIVMVAAPVLSDMIQKQCSDKHMTFLNRDILTVAASCIMGPSFCIFSQNIVQGGGDSECLTLADPDTQNNKEI